jgi:hypothetical protein
MGLAAGQGPATKTNPFLQACKGRLTAGSLEAGLDGPIEAVEDEFFEGGFSLSSHDFRAVQETLGQINGCFHWQ